MLTCSFCLLVASVQAAKLSGHSYNGAKEGANAFANWMSPCSQDHLPKDMAKAFGILVGASPKLIPKGGFKPPEEHQTGQWQSRR